MKTERQVYGHGEEVGDGEPGQNRVGRTDHLATRQHHDVGEVRGNSPYTHARRYVAVNVGELPAELLQSGVLGRGVPGSGVLGSVVLDYGVLYPGYLGPGYLGTNSLLFAPCEDVVVDIFAIQSRRRRLIFVSSVDGNSTAQTTRQTWTAVVAPACKHDVTHKTENA